MHNNNQLKYRSDIDGLRAFAVLFVVIYHLFPNILPGGFIGVDIFFVISGFLISSIIFQKIENRSFSLKEFYERRVIRIFPALLIVLVFTYTLGWLLLFDREFISLGKAIAGGIAFIANELFWRADIDYFSSEKSPLLNLWSLGVEEQFYLFWPFLALLCFKFKKYYLRIIFSLLIISFAANIILLYQLERVSEAYLMSISRIWEISAGTLLGYCKIYKNKIFRENIYSENIQSFVGFFLIFSSIIIISSEKMFPGFWGLMPVIGTFLIINSGENSFLNRTLLSNKFLVYIGLISYPIYLWHWPLLIYNNYLSSGNPSQKSLITVFILTIILSILTYHILEKPIKKANRRIIIYSLSTISIIFFITGIITYKGLLKPYSNQFNLQELNSAATDWDFPTKNLHKEFYKNSSLYMNKKSANKILFIGDSNMIHYAPRIEQVVNEHKNLKINTIFYTMGGCMPIKHIIRKGQTKCPIFMNDAYSYAEDPDIKKIVIAADWLGYLQKDAKTYYIGESSKEFLSESPTAISKILNELSSDIKKLVSLNKSIYIVLNIPRGDELSPLKRIQRSLRHEKFIYHAKSINKNNLLKSNDSFLLKLKETVSQAGAHVIDPLDYLCDNNSVCPSLYQNKPIYTDANHLRATFSREHVKYLDFLLLEMDPNRDLVTSDMH